MLYVSIGYCVQISLFLLTYDSVWQLLNIAVITVLAQKTIFIGPLKLGLYCISEHLDSYHANMTFNQLVERMPDQQINNIGSRLEKKISVGG